jgi:hypothetical protein
MHLYITILKVIIFEFLFVYLKYINAICCYKHTAVTRTYLLLLNR